MIPGLALALVLALAAYGALTECPSAPGGAKASSARHDLYYWAELAPIRVGTPFALRIEVCSKAGAAPPERLAVDAGMPAHRHGMNYTPSVVSTGEGRFRAEGFLFHMPGHWRLVFDLREGASSERLAADLTIE